RAVRAPNRLLVDRVDAAVDTSFAPATILRVRVNVQDSRRDDVEHAVVTVRPSLAGLVAMKPVHRTDVHGETELDFRARQAVQAGLRLTLLVGAHAPGAADRKS